MIVDKDSLPKLPKGWLWTILGEIIDIRNGFAFKSADYQDNGVLLVRQSNLGHGKVDIKKVAYLPLSYLDKYAYFVIRKGDVLVGMSGSIGKLCVYDLDTPALQNQRTGLIQFFQAETREYVRYYFDTLGTRLISMGKGVAVQNISAAQIESCPIPLSPLPEQRRIVAKIEQLFTRLDAGVEALKKVKAQLKRYRQAVLKYAFEGKLTEEWRKANKGKIEPASALLERVREERKTKAKGKYKEPPLLDTLDLRQIAKGWAWARLGMVCNKIQDGSHFSPKIQYKTKGEGRYLYVTAKNIKENGIDLYDVTYVDPSFHKSIYKRCNPEKGDVLLIKDGVKTGIATINHLDQQFSLLSSVALFKVNKTVLNSMYLKWFFNSPVGFKTITGQMTGTAIRRIILERIRLAHIPIASLLEQHKIVEEIERRLSVAYEVERGFERGLKQAERLRQSILKKAFEGKLVPQYPTDEPASVLLERIKTEKAKRDADQRVNKGRKKQANVEKMRFI